jgi:uncharacterized membrane protein YhaH (DUF805 family)
VSFADAVRSVFGKYAVFDGRARRSEYWYWVLAVGIAYIVTLIVRTLAPLLGLVLELIVFLPTIIPGLAVAVRRLHDTGKSGWWLFIELVPVAGVIVLVVFTATDSTPGPNQYGPSPKDEPGGYFR